MCGSTEMMEQIDNGEMKLVQINVTLIVPSDMTMDIVERNVEEGILYILEEHCFFIDDAYEEVSDDVTLLKITSEDIMLEGKENG